MSASLGPPPTRRSCVHPLAQAEQTQPPFHYLEDPYSYSSFLALVKHCSSLRFSLLPISPPKSMSSHTRQCNYPSMCPRLGTPGWGAGIGSGLLCAPRTKQQREVTEVGLSKGLLTACLASSPGQGQSARPQPWPALLPGSVHQPWDRHPAPARRLPTAPGSHLTLQQHFLLLAMPFSLKHPFLWTPGFPPFSLAIFS